MSRDLPDERPSPIKLLLKIECDLRLLDRALHRVRADFETMAAIVESVAITQDLGSGYPWPRDAKERGLRARQIREAAGLTRAQLATYTGLADSTIRNVETGRHKPTEATLAKLLTQLEDLASKQKRTEEGKPSI